MATRDVAQAVHCIKMTGAAVCQQFVSAVVRLRHLASGCARQLEAYRVLPLVEVSEEMSREVERGS